MAKYLSNRNKKELFVDITLLFIASILIIGALSYNGSNFSHGLQNLFQQFLHRSSLKSQNNEFVSLKGLFEILMFELREDFASNNIIILIIILSWFALLKKRDWLNTSLLFSFILFSIILRNYVGVHHFARLPLVFFAIISVLLATDHLLHNLTMRFKEINPGYYKIAGLILLAAFGIYSNTIPQWYKINNEVNNTRTAFRNILNKPDNLLILPQCNRFIFRYDKIKYINPYDRIGAFYLSQYVIKATQNRQAPQKCLIDLAKETTSIAD